MALSGGMNPRFVGFAALLGALFFLFSMNSRGPTHTEQLSSQLFGEIRSIQARWGSGGEATVLKQQVAELHKRIADLERHATRSQPVLPAPASVAPAAAAPATVFEPLCQVTFGRKVCMRGGVEEACPDKADIDRRDGAVPTASGAWRLQAANYTYFMDRGLVSALAKHFAGGSVLELGAGKGCYSAALRRTGLMTGVRAIDGAPGVAEMTGGLVHTLTLTLTLTVTVTVTVTLTRPGAHGRPDCGAAARRGRLGALPRGGRAHPALYLPYISPISPLYLPMRWPSTSRAPSRSGCSPTCTSTTGAASSCPG